MHLPRELRQRGKLTEVVDRADDARDSGTEQHAPHLAGEVEERDRRNDDADEDRQPAESRDGTLVDPACVRMVDDAEKASHAADRGRQQDDDAEGDHSSVGEPRV